MPRSNRLRRLERDRTLSGVVFALLCVLFAFVRVPITAAADRNDGMRASSSHADRDTVFLQVEGGNRGFALRWITPPALSCTEFTIERAWAPTQVPPWDKEWVEVYRMPGLCDPYDSISYYYVDAQSSTLREGVLQYRITGRTPQGTPVLAHSPVVFLGVPARLSIEAVYPQPATTALTLLVSLPLAGDAELRVYDNAGRLLTTRRHERLAVGMHALGLALGMLAPGQYLVELRAADNSEWRRVVVGW